MFYNHLPRKGIRMLPISEILFRSLPVPLPSSAPVFQCLALALLCHVSRLPLLAVALQRGWRQERREEAASEREAVVKGEQ